MTQLGSRTVLIVGGAGGMGAATAWLFAKAGDHVVIADLAGERLTATAREIASTGGKVLPIAFDIRSAEGCRAMVASAAASTGRLDVLVNAAGVWLEGASADVTEAEWDQVMNVNLKGAFFVIAPAIPHLAQARGVIINIASDAGLVGNNGAAVYCASKGGLVLLTKALALELAPHGVRVNAVCPADVATQMIEHQAATYGDGDPAGYKAKLLGHYPQGATARFIEPGEIARFIHYLCDPAATPITGAALSIDFGVTAGY